MAFSLILAGITAVSDAVGDPWAGASTPSVAAAAKADEAFSYNPRTGTHGHIETGRHADPPRNTPWVAAGGVGLLIAGFGLVGAVLMLGSDGDASAEPQPPKKPVFDGIELGKDGLDDELRALVDQRETR
jgi:hypothetical protein